MVAGCRHSEDQAESVHEVPHADAALQEEATAGGQAGADSAPGVGRQAVAQWASKLGQRASKIGESAREALAHEMKMFAEDMCELKTAVKEVTLEGATLLPRAGGTGGTVPGTAVVDNGEEERAGDPDQAAAQNVGAGAGRTAVVQWASKLGQRASKLKETAREAIAHELEKRREEALQSGAGAGVADMPRVEPPLDGQPEPEPCSAARAQRAQVAARIPVVQWASKLGQKASRWGESAREALAHQEAKPESGKTGGDDATGLLTPALVEPNSGVASSAPDVPSAATPPVNVSTPDAAAMAIQEGTSVPQPLLRLRVPPATPFEAAPASSPDMSDASPVAHAETLTEGSAAAEGFDGPGAFSPAGTRKNPLADRAPSSGEAAPVATTEEVNVDDIFDFSPVAVVDAVADNAAPLFPAPPTKVPATTAPAVTDKSFDDLWDSILED